MATAAQVVKRWAILGHRWLGVALCSLFTLWFLSAIPMVYVSFPEVTERDRLAHAPALDAAAVRVAPAAAYAALAAGGPPARTVLEVVDGRPAYRFTLDSGDAIVYADDGARRPPPTPAMLRAAAAAWAGAAAGEPAASAMALPDQWTLEGALRTTRPMWKFSFPDGQQVYVTGKDARVVQWTTPRARALAWIGPIPHFLYFAPLRRHRDVWWWLVLALSGIGAASALLGLGIAWTTFSPSRRFRRKGAPAYLPYSGQKRWHDIFGLSFGITACTWAFSGMLSLEPFPPPETPFTGAAGRVERATRAPAPLEAFDGRGPAEALRALPGASVKTLELAAVAGEPMYVATDGAGNATFVPLAGAPVADYGAARGVDAMRAAAAPAALDIRELTRYDAWYRDRRHELPLPVLLVTEHGTDSVRLYVDPAAMRVVGRYRDANWTERWLYHGLHSLDFPWLYDHRPLWDIVVITLLLGGVALCVTSLILAWRVLQRTLP
ncbi:MAG TPA: hypothetical protein VMT93_06175 [Gemmatimonadaceae bacterium]|nr:hypothetical protein [Gemmatimonadaceae bacterium]